jgi:hypothetical protein
MIPKPDDFNHFISSQPSDAWAMWVLWFSSFIFEDAMVYSKMFPLSHLVYTCMYVYIYYNDSNTVDPTVVIVIIMIIIIITVINSNSNKNSYHYYNYSVFIWRRNFSDLFLGAYPAVPCIVHATPMVKRLETHVFGDWWSGGCAEPEQNSETGCNKVHLAQDVLWWSRYPTILRI